MPSDGDLEWSEPQSSVQPFFRTSTEAVVELFLVESKLTTDRADASAAASNISMVYKSQT